MNFSLELIFFISNHPVTQNRPNTYGPPCKKASRVCKFDSFSEENQLWKLDGNTLKNKEGLWKSVDSWAFRKKDNESIYIENISKKKFLETNVNQDILEENFEEDKAAQLWKTGEPDAEGYLTLSSELLTTENLTLVITATSESEMKINGKNSI